MAVSVITSSGSQAIPVLFQAAAAAQVGTPEGLAVSLVAVTRVAWACSYKHLGFPSPFPQQSAWVSNVPTTGSAALGAAPALSCWVREERAPRGFSEGPVC